MADYQYAIERERQDVVALFAAKRAQGGYLNVQAPMVRYSKLAFRQLTRRHGVDVSFTPMIVASSFVQSPKARAADFSTASNDEPLVAQFAAADAETLAAAAVLMAPHVDAVDLNCGCPQHWAMADGLGSALIYKPELVADAVRMTRRRADLPVSIKIRLRDTDAETVEFMRRAEAAGAAWITVHGRTPAERHDPIHVESLRLAKAAVSVPVVVNGDIFTLADADALVAATDADGAMAARGLLTNPALFAGSQTVPAAVVGEYLHDALATGTSFPILHHHLILMTEKLFCRAERQEFSRLTSFVGILEFMKERYGIVPIDATVDARSRGTTLRL